MLSQTVLSAHETMPNTHPDTPLSVTRVSPCAYETYVNYHRLDPNDGQPGAVANLRMSDGHWQEEQMLQNLQTAGWEMKHIGEDQLTVSVGRAKTPGRPDGFVKVNGDWDQLEMKAVNENRYNQMRRKGLEPRIKAQVQLYMASEECRYMGIKRTWVYMKHKDSCLPYDFEETYDHGYSAPIIEAMDRIVREEWVPRKRMSVLCATCSHRMFCWDSQFVLDLHGIKTQEDLEYLVPKWKEGKYHESLAKKAMDPVKAIFKAAIGEDDVMLVGDLKVTRTISHTVSISTDRYLEVHGKDQLEHVLQDTQGTRVLIKEL